MLHSSVSSYYPADCNIVLRHWKHQSRFLCRKVKMLFCKKKSYLRSIAQKHPNCLCCWGTGRVLIIHSSRVRTLTASLVTQWGHVAHTGHKPLFTPTFLRMLLLWNSASVCKGHSSFDQTELCGVTTDCHGEWSGSLWSFGPRGIWCRVISTTSNPPHCSVIITQDPLPAIRPLANPY